MVKKHEHPTAEDDIHSLPPAEREAKLKSLSVEALQHLKTDYMSELKSDQKILKFNDKLFYTLTASGAAAALGAMEVAIAIVPEMFGGPAVRKTRRVMATTFGVGAVIGGLGYAASNYIFRPHLVASIEQMNMMIESIDKELARKQSESIVIPASSQIEKPAPKVMAAGLEQSRMAEMPAMQRG